MSFSGFFFRFGGFASAENGATAIEYGLLAAILALGLFGALAGTGGATQATYEFLQTQYKAATGF